MKSLSSLPPSLLIAYYRSQNDYVKSNYRKAVGLKDSSFEDSQLIDNQQVKIIREIKL